MIEILFTYLTYYEIKIKIFCVNNICLYIICLEIIHILFLFLNNFKKFFVN